MTAFAAGFGAINTLSALDERNETARLRTSQVAFKHAKTDAIIGGLGGIIPGMGPIALVTTMSMQVPFYMKLVSELSEIYSATPDRFSHVQVAESTAIGAAGMLAVDFGVDFIKEIAPDVMKELGLGFFASAIPIVGIAVTAALDAAIAATMTWRIGTMVSLYYQNGHHWVRSRNNTWKLSSKIAKGVSATTENRVDFNTLPGAVREVYETQISVVISHMNSLKKAGVSEEVIYQEINSRGLQAFLLAEASRRFKEQHRPT